MGHYLEGELNINGDYDEGLALRGKTDILASGSQAASVRSASGVKSVRLA